jgi:hypothetical protein
MHYARYLLGVCLLATAAQSRADWVDTDITDIIDNVQGIYNRVVLGEIHTVASDLVAQIQMRSETVTDTVDELLAYFAHRRAPFLDFVNGGTEKCGLGSVCAQFRADLKVFALDIANLKDRFPVFEQMGLGDTRLLADTTDILPPFVLFGLYEILRSTPDWKDLPAVLADLYDEIGDPDAFALDPGTATTASAVNEPRMQIAATTRTAAVASIGSPTKPADKFCSRGKEPKVDPVRLNHLKSQLFRWKNVINSVAEYIPDEADIDLAGEGAGDAKIPAAPFFKTLGNAIDNILYLVDTYRADFDACAKVEADVAQCAQLATYRTPDGVQKAYWVVYGVVNRDSSVDAPLDRRAANSLLNAAKSYYRNGDWKGAYKNVCGAYAAL